MNLHLGIIFRNLMLCFLLAGILYAQENNSLNLHTISNDTTKIENNQKYKLILSTNVHSKSPLLSLGKAYDPFVETFEFIVPIYFEEEKNQPLSYSERQRIKNEINLAMKIYRDGKRKSDLGVFGQVLGYSQTAAVLGLAIYHIHKYGFK